MCDDLNGDGVLDIGDFDTNGDGIIAAKESMKHFDVIYNDTSKQYFVEPSDRWTKREDFLAKSFYEYSKNVPMFEQTLCQILGLSKPIIKLPPLEKSQ